MENQHSNLENWIYRWNEEQQRFVRAQRRDPHLTEGAQQQSAATQTVIEIEGVPQKQTSTTQTVSFAGTNFRLRPTVLFPRRPIGVTRPSSAPARPPAPAVTSPVTVRPNTSLGQVYHTDGTVSAPEGLTGQRVNRSQKRTRDGGENDETEESPRSRARWVSPSRPSRPPLPDAPDSPDPSPPSSRRESPTPIVIPDTPPPSPPPSPPLSNIRRRLGARPAPDRPAPPASTRPAPDRTAPPPPERPPPLRPAPDRPAPPPPTRPSSPQVPPPSSPMLITLINGENQRTFRAERNANDTEVRWTRVRDPSTVPVPENHTTIIRNGGTSSGGSSSSRQFLNPTLAASHNETVRLLDRLERSIRRVVTRNHQNHQPIQNHQPFQYTHTRRPDNPREHYTIVPSWAVKAEDKRGQCNVCFEENTHLQIKCIRCNNQCVCCKCVIGIYRHINPCPMCSHRGER